MAWNRSISGGTRAGWRNVAPACLATVLCFVASLPATEAQRAASIPENGRGWFLVPTVRVDTYHNDNLFFRADQSSGGVFERISPALAAHFRSSRWSFVASLDNSGEKYQSGLEALDQLGARQSARIQVVTRPSLRNQFSVGATAQRSKWPGDLLSSDGQLGIVELGRRDAVQYGAQSSFSRAVTRRTNVTGSYAYTQQETDADGFGKLDSNQHAVSVGLVQQRSSRWSINLDYQFRAFGGDQLRTTNGDAPDFFMAHVVVWGASRRLGENSQLSFLVGPRYYESLEIGAGEVGDGTQGALKKWRVSADASLQLSQAWRRLDLSLGLSRSQTQVFGAGGFVQTDGAMLSWGWTPGNRFRLSASGGVFWSQGVEQGSLRHHRIGASVSRELTRWMNFSASYAYSKQRGSLTFFGDSERLELQRAENNVWSMSLTLGRALEL